MFLISFVGKKKMAYGKDEYPPLAASVMHGLSVSFVLMFSLALHIFHILNFGWALALALIVLAIIKMFFG